MKPNTTITFRGEQREIADLPLPVLITVFLRWRAMSADLTLAIAKEIRRRNPVIQTSYLRARLNQIDPPPCWCGKPGLYIVGLQTYCRKHKVDGIDRRRHLTQMLDKRKSEFEEFQGDLEKRKKTMDAIKRIDPRRQRKPK
jgi:hypothetical protein